MFRETAASAHLRSYSNDCYVSLLLNAYVLYYSITNSFTNLLYSSNKGEQDSNIFVAGFYNETHCPFWVPPRVRVRVWLTVQGCVCDNVLLAQETEYNHRMCLLIYKNCTHCRQIIFNKSSFLLQLSANYIYKSISEDKMRQKDDSEIINKHKWQTDTRILNYV